MKDTSKCPPRRAPDPKSDTCNRMHKQDSTITPNTIEEAPKKSLQEPNTAQVSPTRSKTTPRIIYLLHEFKRCLNSAKIGFKLLRFCFELLDRKSSIFSPGDPRTEPVKTGLGLLEFPSSWARACRPRARRPSLRPV